MGFFQVLLPLLKQIHSMLDLERILAGVNKCRHYTTFWIQDSVYNIILPSHLPNNCSVLLALDVKSPADLRSPQIWLRLISSRHAFELGIYVQSFPVMPPTLSDEVITFQLKIQFKDSTFFYWLTLNFMRFL